VTPSQVNELSTILLGAGIGFSVSRNPDKVGDWVVACSPGGAVDMQQVAAVETQLGITSPVTGEVTFV
jgi:glucokinase